MLLYRKKTESHQKMHIGNCPMKPLFLIETYILNFASQLIALYNYVDFQKEDNPLRCWTGL